MFQLHTPYTPAGSKVMSLKSETAKKIKKTASLKDSDMCLQISCLGVQKKPTNNFTPGSHEYVTDSKTVLCTYAAAKKNPLLYKTLAMPAEFLKTVLEPDKPNFSCVKHTQFQ